jgi:hypothetical protein
MSQSSININGVIVCKHRWQRGAVFSHRFAIWVKCQLAWSGRNERIRQEIAVSFRSLRENYEIPGRADAPSAGRQSPLCSCLHWICVERANSAVKKTKTFDSATDFLLKNTQNRPNSAWRTCPSHSSTEQWGSVCDVGDLDRVGTHVF